MKTHRNQCRFTFRALSGFSAFFWPHGGSPGQARDKPGQARDKPGTSPGQARDKPGTRTHHFNMVSTKNSTRAKFCMVSVFSVCFCCFRRVSLVLSVFLVCFGDVWYVSLVLACAQCVSCVLIVFPVCFYGFQYVSLVSSLFAMCLYDLEPRPQNENTKNHKQDRGTESCTES